MGQSMEHYSPCIGDKVPDIEYRHVLNYEKPSFRLSDFKGKMIIIDFWATWCSSCLAGFAKAQALQKAFSDSLQFIMVNSITGTGDSCRKISKFFQQWNQTHDNPFSFPTPIEDSITRQLFPHTYIPHCVWIGSDGRLAAITSSKELTTENIRKVLSGQRLTISKPE
jgi:thiol-disulfide isomerase/thioredoxin